MSGAKPSPETKRDVSKLHIMVFPYPAQGHLLPLLDLAHQLCLNGLTVSIIVTPKNLPYLSSLLSAHPSVVSAVTVPFPHHPSIPPGVENIKDLGCSGNLPMMASLRQLREPIINWLSSHPSPPVALISDFFFGWPNDLGIPRFAFFSSGALMASVLHFLSDKLHLFESMEPVCFSDLPRSPVLKKEYLSPLASRDLESIRDITMNFSSYGCIFNSCECLEGEYIEHVKQKASHNRVFSVGPLSSIGLGRGHSESNLDVKALLSWLDGCSEGYVLYVCFGSQKVLTKEQCDALALGLEKSMARFIWVAKKDPIIELY